MQHLNRRHFLATLGAATAAWTRPAWSAEARGERPNFVIMIADDVGWNDLGCTGHPHIRTPNIDGLAQEGLNFECAFLSCSSCSPSRASIMTGRYPHSTGAQNLHDPLPAEQVVFAGLLKDAGYYTASAGKWHLGPHAKKHFHAVLGGGNASGCGNWLKALRERPKDKPFFLWLAAKDAHRGYRPNIIPQPHTPEDAVVPPFLPDTPAVRRDLALYYDEIARLDGYVGQVMAELKRQGVDENTMVLWLSDNGRPFPRCKTTVYDSGVKTPFIVRWPDRVKPGRVCPNLVSPVDIAPTLVELAGLQPPAAFQGVSFAPMLRDPTASVREHVFAEHNWHDYQAHERMARSTRYLYLRNAVPHLPRTPPADAVRSPTYRAMLKLEAQDKLPPRQRGPLIAPRPKEELYDAEADPYQLHNLADDPKHAEALDRLRAALDAWIERTDDRVPKHPKPDQFHRTTGRRLRRK
jgi:arylsulfatase A-like enzyme